MEVNNELTDCVSLLHPSTLVSLTSSLTSGYTSIFYSPKTWIGSRCHSNVIFTLYLEVLATSCPYLPWRDRLQVSDDLCPRSSNRDISEALEREVADRTCAKPCWPKEALQKDSFWRKEQICWASPKKKSKKNTEIFPLKRSKSRWKESLY